MLLQHVFHHILHFLDRFRKSPRICNILLLRNKENSNQDISRRPTVPSLWARPQGHPSTTSDCSSPSSHLPIEAGHLSEEQLSLLLNLPESFPHLVRRIGSSRAKSGKPIPGRLSLSNRGSSRFEYTLGTYLSLNHLLPCVQTSDFNLTPRNSSLQANQSPFDTKYFC